ncbi:MAG TPA: rhodanese-like domain-containing protein [Longimicrobiales bacterium]|nr:rhodanese-like domain-containing protein [Longimicrobiales bacterium]
MNAQEIRQAIDDGVIPLDLRTPRPFAERHLPGAVNLQFNRADLADRAEMLLPPGHRYVVHAEPEPIARIAAKILADAGFEVLGHLEGGLAAWEGAGLPTESLEVLDVDELHRRTDEFQVVDVREGFEFRHSRIPGAASAPWTETWEAKDGLSRDRPLAIVCGDEVRSAAAASILKRTGFRPALVLGGMIDWLERGYPIEGKKAPVRG